VTLCGGGGSSAAVSISELRVSGGEKRRRDERKKVHGIGGDRGDPAATNYPADAVGAAAAFGADDTATAATDDPGAPNTEPTATTPAVLAGGSAMSDTGPPEQGRAGVRRGASIASQAKLAIVVLAVAALVTFLLQNRQDADVQFLWFDWSTQLVWALLASALVGVVASALLTTLATRGGRG